MATQVPKMATQVDEKQATELIENASQQEKNGELENNRPDTSYSTFEQYVNQFSDKSIHNAIEKFCDEDFQTRYPKPFIVDIFPEDWHGKAVPNIQKYLNFKVRCARVTGIFLVAIICLIIATYKTVSMATICGSGLLAMFTLYFCYIFYYAFGNCSSGSKLYRVYSVSNVPYSWIALKTGYIQLIYENESVQSISELSAIHGGVTKTMLNTIGAYTWAAIVIHFVAQLYYNRCIFHWDLVDMCECVGAGGLLLISIFELDPFRTPMRVMHYFGAALGFGTVVGYCIQQYYIGERFVFAMVVGTLTVVGFVSWQLIGIATNVAQVKIKALYRRDYAEEIRLAAKENREVQISKLQWLIPSFFKGHNVNTYSRMNIAFEALFLYLGALCLCLWLIEYDSSCELGCAGNYNEEVRDRCTKWYYDDFYL